MKRATFISVSIILLIFLSIAAGCGEEERSAFTREQVMELMTRAELGEAALAQLEFYAENEYYTLDLNDLEEFGFEPSDGVTVLVASADAVSYCIEGAHDEGGSYWSFGNDIGFMEGNNC